MQTFETEIVVPHILYQKNPIKAIKSLLGNDITIVSYTVSDLLTTNEEYLIKVVYTSIDFSPFEIYKVKNVKRLNTNSDKYVGELETTNWSGANAVSDSEVNSVNETSETTGVNTPKKLLGVQEPRKIAHKAIFIKLNSNISTKKGKSNFVKINTLTQNNIDEDIIYYGDIIENIQDIMTNFCSAFCTTKLSYHGSNISINIDINTPFNKLITLKNVGITESPQDKKVFDDFQSMSHDYSRNYFDISYLKQQISSKINILSTTPAGQIKQPGIYSFESLTFTELKEILLTVKTGIFFLLAERTNPFYLIYIPNHEITIKPHLIEHMLTVIAKDVENIQKFLK